MKRGIFVAVCSIACIAAVWLIQNAKGQILTPILVRKVASVQFAPNNMTTNTAPSPYVASASSENLGTTPTRDAYRAFDGTTGGNGGWLGDLFCQAHEWLEIDLGAGNPRVLGSYAINVNTVPEPTRAPKNWTLIGSNLGYPPQFAPKNMSGNSTPSPYVAAASSAFRPAYQAFNGVIGAAGTDWLGTGGGVDWLRIDLGAGGGFPLLSYAVAVNTQPEAARAPKNWTLEGSTDASSWTVLDTQTNQTSWGSGEIRSFTCGAPSATAFRYYRINITANNGDGTFTQVDELFLNSPGWTVVDTQTNQTSWTSGQTRTFTCSTPVGTAFRYYSVNITANNGDSQFTQICELTLYTP